MVNRPSASGVMAETLALIAMVIAHSDKRDAIGAHYVAQLPEPRKESA
jgi:hypothetical protein